MKFTDSDRLTQATTYAELAEGLAAELAQTSGTLVFSIAGAQGTGKSTFAGMLADALVTSYSESVATLSLDDFYLTRPERMRLAETVHPLLATRGVPGTHDIEAMSSAITSLGRGDVTPVPVFDKAADDRASQYRMLGPARIILCEGWCWGARPEPAERLDTPVNDLERLEDSDGRWRQWVNKRLHDYQPVFDTDGDLFLAAPSMQAVEAWRWQQEENLARDRDGDHIMTRQQISEFIAYYERLTSWMLEDLPGRVKLTAILKSDHSIGEIRLQ